MSFLVWVLTLPQWFAALIVLVVSVFLGVGSVLLLRRLLPDSVLPPQNDTAGFVFGALCAIYGLMLAFIVVNVWVQHDSTKAIVEQESSAALALYRNLNAYPNHAETDKALAALRDVTLSMEREEFAAIRTMKWDSKTQASLRTQQAINKLWVTMRLMVPRNLHEQSLFNEILMEVNSLAQFRVKRLLQARIGLSGSLWAVVVLGGLVCVGFLALFGYESERVRRVHAGILSAVIGGAIYVIVSLNFPFTGESGIAPDGYDYLIKLAGWS